MINKYWVLLRTELDQQKQNIYYSREEAVVASDRTIYEQGGVVNILVTDRYINKYWVIVPYLKHTVPDNVYSSYSSAEKVMNERIKNEGGCIDILVLDSVGELQKIPTVYTFAQ